MPEAYAGLLGAYVYALRRTRSWVCRSYVVASAAVGLFIAVILLLAVVSWAAHPVAFGERTFLGVIGIVLLLPLTAPVLLVARRHRLSGSEPAADRWLALAGYGFVAAIVLALFVSDPTAHATTGPFGPVVAGLDALPNGAWVVFPVVAAAAIVVAARRTRPGRD